MSAVIQTADEKGSYLFSKLLEYVGCGFIFINRKKPFRGRVFQAGI